MGLCLFVSCLVPPSACPSAHSLTHSHIHLNHLNQQKQLRALKEQAAAAEAKLREQEAGHRAAAEETGRSIRFLEKENLELMMEIKALKDRITQVEVLRGAGAGKAVTPLGPSSVANAPLSMAAATAPAGPVEPIKTAAAPAPVMTAAPCVVDKENGGAGGVVVVGEALLRARSDDETAPPFRSLNEDDTVNAGSQCKQS